MNFPEARLSSPPCFRELLTDVKINGRQDPATPDPRGRGCYVMRIPPRVPGVLARLHPDFTGDGGVASAQRDFISDLSARRRFSHLPLTEMWSHHVPRSRVLLVLMCLG